MIIKKKVWVEYFEKILSGEKTFEVRLADFECNPGDTLLLQEWDHIEKKYTGREITKCITYVAKTKNFPFWTQQEIEEYGYQIIAFSSEKKS